MTGGRLQAGEPAPESSGSVQMYFLSLRGRRGSFAQLRHNHFHFFASPEAADAHRTFAGDNSRISRLTVSVESYDFLFTKRGTAIADVRVLDLIELFPLPPDPIPVPFKRGDVDGSGSVDLSDPIRLLHHLFLGSAAPACPDAADSNDSGDLDLSDAIHTLGWLFLGGPPPPRPGPHKCGPDRTPSRRLRRCRYDPKNCP